MSEADRQATTGSDEARREPAPAAGEAGRSAPISRFVTRRRMEFADTDVGGIVHFSRFFVFMETAEHELLRALGTSVHVKDEAGRVIGWPRVEASCEYLSPARFEEELEIEVEVARKGEKSMTYRFTFRIGARVVARGTITSVCCVLNDPAGLLAIPLPEVVARGVVQAASSE